MPNSKRTEKQIKDTKATRKDYLGDKKTESRVHDIEFSTSSLETIDKAVIKYVDERLNLSVTTNEGFKKVPVLWVTAERAYQLKHNKDLRDSEETLILPLITIDRKSIEKNPAKDFAIPAANIPEVRDAMGGSITVARRVNQKKTAEFQNAYSKRIYDRSTWPKVKADRTVYQTMTIPFPTWVAINYEISVRTEYQQQSNEIISKFVRQGGLNSMPFRIENEGHKYEAFINGSITNNSNVADIGMKQRNYESIIGFKVLGYLYGDGENQETPNLVIRENAVEVKLPRENVIFGNIQDFLDNSGFYKE